MAGTFGNQEVSSVDILDIIEVSRLDDLEKVFNHLGITDRDIDNTKLRDQHNPEKQAKNIINLWCNRNGEEATRVVFTTAMKKVTVCIPTAKVLEKKWKLTPPEEAAMIPDPVPVRPIDAADIMISYQWDAQPRMIKLKEELTRRGYKVWLDIEKMEGDMDECMAKAVEEAKVVFWCISTKYQASENCKKEAQYSKTCKNIDGSKKHVILLKYEDFTPSGWLGIQKGNLKYYDVKTDKSMMKNIPGIIQELVNKGVPCQPNVE